VIGWPAEYWSSQDLEAERLFDYAVLAPPVAATPLVRLTCQDTRLAGAGELGGPGVVPRKAEGLALLGMRMLLGFKATR
jgi:hypothetical protein